MARKSKAKEESPALTLIRHMWNNALGATSHSWERLNRSMCDAVQLAIFAGIRFAPGDFEAMAADMRANRWRNVNSDEFWYTLAIKERNASAVKAIEAWLGRKPFLIVPSPGEKTRVRLHVGERFEWKGELVTVTSFTTNFTEDDGYVTACTYKPRPEPERCKACRQEKHEYSTAKIERRFRITHADIAKYHAELRAQEKAAAEEAEKKAERKQSRTRRAG